MAEDCEPDLVAIRARCLELSFSGERAICDIHLEIPRGRFVAVVGPSGCGKTSLLRMVAGLEQPTAGSLQVRGRNAGADPRLGFVFQDPHLLPWRNVVENVRLPREIGRVASESTSAEIDDVIQMLADLPMPPPSIRRLQLWSHPLTGALIVILLGVFWVWRKTVGLV